MKFSEQWLREWIDLPVDTNQLLDQLTMAGLEVDSSNPVVDFSLVVVGEIVDLKPHPNADKLQIAMVDIGQETLLQIVCGAKNICIGFKAPTALIGAILPNNFKIKKSKLRGIDSFGMLCAANELGLGDNSSGIMELPSDVLIGQDLVTALDLQYNIIDIDLTPNRGDCLSIQGVSREVAVINNIDINPIRINNITATSSQKINISVKNVKACPVYAGRIINNIDPNAQTPHWMIEKLRRGGIRSLGPLVDITNFVMLELGQPMHAFDLSKIDGNICVRNAHEGESLTLLDEKEIKLHDDTLLITDDKKPLALAGIMGGINSSVSSDTKDIFLESAFFDPIALSGIARNYGMHTESSHRFERGVDCALQIKAINRATELLLDIVGGDCGEIIEVNNLQNNNKNITLNKYNIERLLGIKIKDSTVVNILTRLGMSISQISTGKWQITPPSFRFDISIEADLIEELGRIYGYNNIESTHISVPVFLPKNNESKRNLNTIKQFFTARDYQEIISYSFTNPKTQEILGMHHGAVALSNPISNDLSQMRTSLWASLIPTAAYNLNRQYKRIRFFETGLRFFKDDNNQLQQIPSIAGLICGNRFNDNWNENATNVDFFDMKHDLENLMQIPVKFIKGKHSALHPKQTAEILYDNKNIGFIGKIHPKIAEKLDITENTYLFELDLFAVEITKVPEFNIFSKFPEISRDLSIIIDETISSNRIIETISAIPDNFLKNVRIFDVYKDKNLDKKQQSLAINISLQAKDKTLTEQEIERSINRIIKVLTDEFNAALRK